MPEPADDPSSDATADERNETPDQRADRNLNELLQELRVLSIGVQVLFGFLLTFPLASRFSTLDDSQRALYTISLTAAGVATVVLIGPVAFHRMVFQRHAKIRLVRVGNQMALAGLGAVGTAITTSVWLTMSIGYSPAVDALFGVGLGTLIVLLWLLFPLAGRRRLNGITLPGPLEGKHGFPPGADFAKLLRCCCSPP
jgi:hypothetical protein